MPAKGNCFSNVAAAIRGPNQQSTAVTSIIYRKNPVADVELCRAGC